MVGSPIQAIKAAIKKLFRAPLIPPISKNLVARVAKYFNPWTSVTAISFHGNIFGGGLSLTIIIMRWSFGDKQDMRSIGLLSRRVNDVDVNTLNGCNYADINYYPNMSNTDRAIETITLMNTFMLCIRLY